MRAAVRFAESRDCGRVSKLLTTKRVWFAEGVLERAPRVAAPYKLTKVKVDGAVEPHQQRPRALSGSRHMSEGHARRSYPLHMSASKLPAPYEHSNGTSEPETPPLQPSNQAGE